MSFRSATVHYSVGSSSGNDSPLTRIRGSFRQLVLTVYHHLARHENRSDGVGVRMVGLSLAGAKAHIVDLERPCLIN